jgi:hypothetical protein
MINRGLIGRAALVWAVIAAVLLVWLAVAAVSSASASHSYHNQISHAQTRNHFWQVVSGQADGSEPTVDNKLAVDLQLLKTQKDVAAFHGDSNQYGGITDAIGVDPFDDSCGNECGYLTSYMRTTLAKVQSGQVDAVVTADTVSKPHSTTGTPVLLFIVWLLAGGGLVAWPFVRRHRDANTLKSAYRDESHLLNEARDAMKELGPADPRYDELKGLRDNLEKALERRLGRGTDSGRIDNLVNDLRVNLDAVQEGNKTLDSSS